jgi:hypothetical protein
VVFTSFASNLVPGRSTTSPNFDDVFVRDRRTGTTRRVSESNTGRQANGNAAKISANGRFVTFVSASRRLVRNDTNNNHDVLVRDR